MLFGWLMADLALVYFTSEVHRLPAALAYPAVLAGGTAWLGMRSPKLALLPIMGGLIALLPVFSGTAAPTDVYGPYNTVCYMAVGLGSGWLATRLFWPATATRLLCLRVAGLLDLYREALASGRLADRRQRAALLLAHTRQTAQIAPLHAQARYEPVEDGLDEARRLELLRRVQELFDAVFAARPSTEAGDALLASLAACAAALRGEPEVPTSGPLAADGPLGDVIARQLELEAWVADWQAARSA